MSGIAFQDGIDIRTVKDLYASFEALDVPSYYKDGETNPYSGLCQIISQKSRFYTMVPANDEARLLTARHMMKIIAGRRKLRERLCSTDEVNYNQFAKAGHVVLMWA
jgi:hypothetical protein